jgi:hypothetical protein
MSIKISPEGPNYIIDDGYNLSQLAGQPVNHSPACVIGISATGHLCNTTVTGGSGTVSEVDTGAGLTGGPVTGRGTISLAGVIPADTATFPSNIVYNDFGQITSITSTAGPQGFAISAGPNVVFSPAGTFTGGNLTISATGGGGGGSIILQEGYGITITYDGISTYTISQTSSAITSISQGTGIVCSPNPIVATGVISLSSLGLNAVYGRLAGKYFKARNDIVYSMRETLKRTTLLYPTIVTNTIESLSYDTSTGMFTNISDDTACYMVQLSVTATSTTTIAMNFWATICGNDGYICTTNTFGTTPCINLSAPIVIPTLGKFAPQVSADQPANIGGVRDIPFRNRNACNITIIQLW